MRKKTKRLIRRKIIASEQTMSRWSFTGCRAGSWRVGQLDSFFRFFSRILASVHISADQSFFSSSESSASSSIRTCTAAQTAGFLSAERNNLTAERFPFEMVLLVPSVASSRELLNSYCT